MNKILAAADIIPNAIDGVSWAAATLSGGVAQVVPGGTNYSDYMDTYNNNQLKKEWEVLRAQIEHKLGQVAEHDFNMIQNIKNHTQNPKEVQIPRTGEIHATPIPEIRSAKPMEIRAPENTRTVPGTGEIRKNNE